MRYLWLARFGSFFAEHLSDTIIALLVWKLTSSELLAALIIASGRIALWLFGLLTAIMLGALNFISMAAKTFEASAMNTLISSIKDTQEFKDNNIFIDSSKRFARILSPILLLVLLDEIATTGMLIIIAASYTFVLACYLRASSPANIHTEKEDKNKLSMNLIKQSIDKRIFSMFALFGFYNLSYFSAIWIFLPYHFASTANESDFGWALLAFSIGGLIGNRAYKNFLSSRTPFSNLLIAIAIVGLACFTFSLSNGLLLICLASAFAGSGLPIMDMAMIEIIRNDVPPNKHGIAFSVFRFLADSGLILGGIIGGLLLQNFTLSLSYALTGVWIGLLLTCAYVLSRKFASESIQ